MLWGYHQPQFYKTGKQQDIDRFLSLQSTISNDLAELKNIAIQNNINIGQPVDRLIALGRQTLIAGNALKQLYYKKGFEDYGQEGEMRVYAHWIENYSSIPKSNILQLRRHEKDFMLRGRAEYAQLYFHTVDSMLRQLPENKSRLELQSYKDSFSKLVRYTEELGINNNIGIAPALLLNIRQFDKQYALTDATAIRKCMTCNYVSI